MANLEMLILGSGTSSQIPVISCLVSRNADQACACCLSTRTPEGVKNLRRNTSAILRVHPARSTNTAPHMGFVEDPEESSRTILIDVGKSFCEAARQHFPANGLSTIDAVLLTHPHADAINGLDDLRAWTLDAVIQKTIPIYCDEFTLSEVSRMFPYMINAASATGGGDVPAFEWHLIEAGKAFDLFGVRISPLQVQHGCCFGPSGLVEGPYGCLAFLFDRSLCYMSDVSAIPESTYVALGAPAPSILGGPAFEDVGDFNSHTTSSSNASSPPTTNPTSVASVSPADAVPLPILVLDTLRLLPHTSHFGIAEAVATAQRLCAQRTYLLGFTHGVTHECWERACEAISAGRVSTSGTEEVTPLTEYELGNHPERFTEEALKLLPASGTAVWVRPAFDGLWIKTDGKTVSDDCY